jgi:hypothetical protein
MRNLTLASLVLILLASPAFGQAKSNLSPTQRAKIAARKAAITKAKIAQAKALAAAEKEAYERELRELSVSDRARTDPGARGGDGA